MTLSSVANRGTDQNLIARVEHSLCAVSEDHGHFGSILSSSSFLATDLIALLSDFEIHTHFKQASEHVMIAENTGIPVVNQDLSLWARSIFGFTQLLGQLEEYGVTYLPMKYEDRPYLTPPESDAVAETANK